MHGGRINSLINMLGQSQAFVYAELHFGLRSSAKRKKKNMTGPSDMRLGPLMETREALSSVSGRYQQA